MKVGNDSLLAIASGVYIADRSAGVNELRFSEG